MSVLEPPASFGLMFPFKEERSRNKERLEASLAALCELELLKQRQESRVLSALCLGDSAAPGRMAWTALRAARCATDAQYGDAADYAFRLQTPFQIGVHDCIQAFLQDSLKRRPKAT